ncbi:MAG: putative Ig domain-containing protein [Deltaproteobacteria bacterium]
MRRVLLCCLALAACSEPADTELMPRDDAGVAPVEAKPLAFVTVDLPDGRLGDAYEATIEGEGGRPPYTWRIVSGDLPFGVELGEGTPSAPLSGTPMRFGNFTFAVDLQDADGTLVTQVFDLLVEDIEPLEILTTEVPAGLEHDAYEAEIECTPGLGPYRWRILRGALPRGLSLGAEDDVALIAGTPTRAGSTTVTVEVRDRYDRAAERGFQITVRPKPPVRITAPETLPPGRVGVPYETMITAADGTPPYSWSTEQTLPAGLTIARPGTPSTRLFGTPEVDGIHTVEVTVYDAVPLSTTRTYRLEILPGALAIRTSTVPSGALCEDYVATLVAEGGTPPYSWSVAQGSLPPGLVFDTAGERIAVIGVPQQAGAFSIDATVTDAVGETQTVSFPIEIGPVTGPRFGVLIGAQLPQRRVWPVDLCAVTPTPMASLSVTAGSEVGVGGSLDSFALSPTRRHFVYAADQGGQRGIFLVDLTGVAPVQTLVAEVASLAEVAVEWSPDGARLAYRARPPSGGSWQLYVVDVTAAPLVSRQIDPESTASTGPTVHMRWSPNGQRLAFIGTHTQAAEAYVADITTATVTTRVVSRGASGPADVVRLAAWSPDSNHLLFNASGLRGDRREIYAIDLQSATATPVPIAPSAIDASLVAFDTTVSAGGEFLAYLSNQQVLERSDLYVVDLGATPFTVVRAASSTSPLAEAAAPKWAPVGEQLAFLARPAPNGPFGIYEADARVATAATRLDPPSMVGGVQVSAAAFAYNHDGSRLAYIADTYSRGRYQHYVAHRSGPYARMVFPLGQLDATHQVVAFEWASGANRMLIAAEPRTGGPAELFVADLLDARSGITTRVGAPMANVFALRPALAISASGARIFYGEVTAASPSPTPVVTYTAGPMSQTPTLLTPADAQVLHHLTR